MAKQKKKSVNEQKIILRKFDGNNYMCRQSISTHLLSIISNHSPFNRDITDKNTYNIEYQTKKNKVTIIVDNYLEIKLNKYSQKLFRLIFCLFSNQGFNSHNIFTSIEKCQKYLGLDSVKTTRKILKEYLPYLQQVTIDEVDATGKRSTFKVLQCFSIKNSILGIQISPKCKEYFSNKKPMQYPAKLLAIKNAHNKYPLAFALGEKIIFHRNLVLQNKRNSKVETLNFKLSVCSLLQVLYWNGLPRKKNVKNGKTKEKIITPFYKTLEHVALTIGFTYKLAPIGDFNKFSDFINTSIEFSFKLAPINTSTGGQLGCDKGIDKVKKGVR